MFYKSTLDGKGVTTKVTILQNRDFVKIGKKYRIRQVNNFLLYLCD